MSSNQLGRPLGPGPQQVGVERFVMDGTNIQDLIEQRATQGRSELFQALLLLNLVILVLGLILSYMLARKTLKPIESAMDAQSQFVSDASHELRTPLTALQTTNEVALRKKNLSTNDAKKLLRHNVNEIEKLHGLTSGLLSLVNVNHVDPIYNKVSLQDVVSEAMNSVIPLAQSKNISVNDDIPLLNVIANKSSIVQVLRILIENAIKYSSDESAVQLTAETSGSHVIVHVVDNGVGIAKEDQEKIFTRFYRVDQSRSKINSDGYGLGLAIAKTLCDHQGMRLTVESIEGKGSTFSIQMKLAED